MIDIFDPTFVTCVCSDRLFGIEDMFPAHVVIRGDRKQWNAVVDNTNGLQIMFVPLDHHIDIHPSTDTTYSLCDCMIYREGHWLTLIELKDQARGWLEDAIRQLKSTIRWMKDNPRVSQFSIREAYAANRRHPHFQSSEKSRMNEFRKETSFRLIITNMIKVK